MKRIVFHLLPRADSLIKSVGGMLAPHFLSFPIVTISRPSIPNSGHVRRVALAPEAELFRNWWASSFCCHLDVRPGREPGQAWHCAEAPGPSPAAGRLAVQETRRPVPFAVGEEEPVAPFAVGEEERKYLEEPVESSQHLCTEQGPGQPQCLLASQVLWLACGCHCWFSVDRLSK